MLPVFVDKNLASEICKETFINFKRSYITNFVFLVHFHWRFYEVLEYESSSTSVLRRWQTSAKDMKVSQIFECGYFLIWQFCDWFQNKVSQPDPKKIALWRPSTIFLGINSAQDFYTWKQDENNEPFPRKIESLVKQINDCF